MTVNQMPRNEEAILSGEFTILLNRKRHTVKERSIRRTKEWIRNVVEADGSVFAKFAAAESSETASILQEMGFSQIGGLLIEYADGVLQQEDIEEATPSELRAAFDQVLEISGFFDLMWGKTKKMQTGRV